MANHEVRIMDVCLAARPVLLGGDLRGALVQTWGAGDAWVLGHAFDGVLWGHVREGRLVMAVDVGVLEAPLFRRETLLDLRVFAERRELRVWRTTDGLRACEVQETSGPLTGQSVFQAVQDRTYALMGAGTSSAAAEGFFELRGRGGQHHTPPALGGVAPGSGAVAPQGLCVRHYFETRDNGLLRMAEHRLLGLSAKLEREQQ